jgi:predicted permease
MGNIIFIAVLLGIGMVLKKINFGDDFSKALNNFVIYISFPCVVLLNVPSINISMQTINIAIIAWLVLFASIIGVLLITKNSDKNVRACLLLVGVLGNTSFLGIPLITAIAGNETMPYILIYDQFGTFLALSIYGAIVVAYFEDGSLNIKSIVKKIVYFPPFIAIVVAFIIGEPSSDIKPYIAILAATLTPLAIVSVGYEMKFTLGAQKAIFVKASILKLIIAPLIGYTLGVMFCLDNIALQTVTLEAGMPSMITAGILAIRHNFAPTLAASMIGYGVLASLLTIPILNFIIKLF